MKENIIRIMKENARISAFEIAENLGIEVSTVEKEIKTLEKDGVIKGYQAIVDDSALPESAVKAIIEVKIRPEREGGFDRIARRLSKFPEVTSLNLVSGSFDLELEVQGASLQEVANFVSSKLAPTDGVVSTNTCFLLKRYKVSGKILDNGEEYEKLKVSP